MVLRLICGFIADSEIGLEACEAEAEGIGSDRRRCVVFKYVGDIVGTENGEITPAYTYGSGKIPGSYISFGISLVFYVRTVYRSKGLGMAA